MHDALDIKAVHI